MKQKSFIEAEFGGTYDLKLDEDIKKNPNPFPRKLALATELIEKYALTKKGKRLKKNKKTPLPRQLELTTLQKELLYLYTFEPNAEQMEKLKDFMLQLFLADVQMEEAKQREHLDKSEKEKIAA